MASLFAGAVFAAWCGMAVLLGRLLWQVWFSPQEFSAHYAGSVPDSQGLFAESLRRLYHSNAYLWFVRLATLVLFFSLGRLGWTLFQALLGLILEAL